VLIHKAIGKNLYCIFVDNGLLRKTNLKKYSNLTKTWDWNVKGVDAKEQFYTALAVFVGS
jgi:GMP synthase (glutamine-hydrolysing)